MDSCQKFTCNPPASISSEPSPKYWCMSLKSIEDESLLLNCSLFWDCKLFFFENAHDLFCTTIHTPNSISSDMDEKRNKNTEKIVFQIKIIVSRFYMVGLVLDNINDGPWFSSHTLNYYPTTTYYAPELRMKKWHEAMWETVIVIIIVILPFDSGFDKTRFILTCLLLHIWLTCLKNDNLLKNNEHKIKATKGLFRSIKILTY